MVRVVYGGYIMGIRERHYPKLENMNFILFPFRQIYTVELYIFAWVTEGNDFCVWFCFVKVEPIFLPEDV